jgi:uncharacterized protein (TIGR00251 family)
VHELFELTDDGDAILRLHVQPGAGRTTVMGRHGDALKVKVGAPPEKGRANAACAELVAELAGIKIADIELVSGEASRSKRFRLKGVDPEELARRLDLSLEEASGNARGRGSVPKSPR